MSICVLGSAFKATHHCRQHRAASGACAPACCSDPVSVDEDSPLVLQDGFCQFHREFFSYFPMYILLLSEKQEYGLSTFQINFLQAEMLETQI